jgi:multiple sugar transport system substrate-binding protein
MGQHTAQRGTRRGVLTAAALAASVPVLSALTGCTSGPQRPGIPGRGQPIRFAFAGGAEETSIEEAVVTRFMEEQDAVGIQLVPFSPADFPTKLLGHMTGYGSPDVVRIGPGYLRTFVLRGLLADLSGLVTRDLKGDLDDFVPTALDAGQFMGLYYGLPSGAMVHVVYYNRRLLEEAGLLAPNVIDQEARWTFESFLDYARRMTNPAAGRYGTSVNISMPDILPWVWSNGGDLLDDGRECLLHRPEAVEALQFLQDLVHRYHAAPRPVRSGDSEAIQLTSGRLGMYLANQAAAPPAPRPNRTPVYGIVSMPRGARGGRATLLQVQPMGIAKASRRVEAAWQFVRFATGPEAATIYAESGRYVPVQKSLLRSETLLRSLQAGQRVLYESVALYGRSPYQHALYLDIEKLVNAELEPLRLGMKSAREVAETIKPKVDALLRGETRA